MKRKVIFNGTEGRFDTAFFPLLDNESLQVEFCLPLINNGVYVLIITHGDASMKVLLKSRIVDIPLEFLQKVGNEPIYFELEKRDKTACCVYARYSIEPLLIQSVESEKIGVASLQKLEEECLHLANKLIAVETELLAVKEELKAVPVAIEKAKREAVVEATGGDPLSA